VGNFARVERQKRPRQNSRVGRNGTHDSRAVPRISKSRYIKFKQNKTENAGKAGDQGRGSRAERQKGWMAGNELKLWGDTVAPVARANKYNIQNYNKIIKNCEEREEREERRPRQE